MSFVFSDEVVEIALPSRPVDLDCSDDGAFIAVALMSLKRGPAIRVYSTQDGAIISEYGTTAMQGRGVAFAENGQQLYFLLRNDEGNDELYRAAVPNGTPEHVADYGMGEHCHSLIRNANGILLAVLGKAIEVWDTSKQEVVRHIEGYAEDRSVYAAFNADQPELYIYGLDQDVVVHFDLAENREIRRLVAPQPFGQQVAVAPSGEFVVAVGLGSQGVFVYNARTGERYRPSMFKETALARLFTFSPDSSLLITWSAGGDAEELATGEWVEGTALPKSRQLAIASALHAPIVAYAQDNNKVYVLKLVEES